MATLAALNAAVTDTAISSTEYNDNMTRIRAAVNTIDAAQLNTNSVTTVKIVDANVTADKLATDSVTTDKILDANVTYAKLADATITSLKTQSYIGTSTRDATAANGDVSYTGFGFQPTEIEVIAGVTGTAVVSHGYIKTGINYGYNLNDNGSTGIVAMRTTTCIYVQTGSGNVQSAVLKTLDSGGVTLTWTKAGSPTGTITLFFIAKRIA